VSNPLSPRIPPVNPAGNCEPKCREHSEHVYILCYGKPTLVRDRDYLLTLDTYDKNYPITHYVGYTTQLPVDRIRQHAAKSAHFIADIRPGTQANEVAIKLYEKCPTCGKSLWYFAESPGYRKVFRRKIEKLYKQLTQE
jgi:hypothetical protein